MIYLHSSKDFLQEIKMAAVLVANETLGCTVCIYFK